MYERLREIITKKGITTNKLARITNIASQDLYNAYKGRKRIYPNWKKRIAEALEMPEEIIFEEGEKMIECICDLCKKRINASDIKMSFDVTVDGKKKDRVDMHSSCYYKFMGYAKAELIDSREE